MKISDEEKREYLLGLYHAWDDAVGRDSAVRMCVQLVYPDNLHLLPPQIITTLAAKVLE